MGNRVQRVRTTVSETEMAQAIIEAWKQLFSTMPTKEQVTMVLAQNALETGHRQKMWNYNVGNIITDGKGSFDFYDDLTTSEQVSPGKWEKMNLKFRSYPNLLAGVRDYLKLISSKKYAGAWSHIVNPNIVAFSKALKQAGYYTANEAPYTKQLSSLYKTISKSDAYEGAKNTKSNIKQIDFSKKPTSVSKPMNFNDQLLSTVNQYLQQVAASEKKYKKLYKKYLPTNNCVIHIQSNNILNSSEFARVLCTALDEELLASASIYTNNKDIEVECTIHGPQEDCFEAIKQLANVLAITFKQATIKIGGVDIKTKLFMNKKSSYQLMDVKTASENYTKFLSLFT